MRHATGLAYGIVLAAVLTSAAPAQFFPETDWTGIYAGIYAGAGTSQSDGAEDAGLDALGGLAGGIAGGFQLQILYGVLGLEGDWGGSSVTGSYEIGTVERDGTVDLDTLAGLRGRAGVTFGSAQIYATGGLALAHAKGESGEAADGEWLGGYSYGLGLEYALTDNFSIDAKYLRSELAAPDWDAFDLGETLHAQDFRLGLNFRF